MSLTKGASSIFFIFRGNRGRGNKLSLLIYPENCGKFTLRKYDGTEQDRKTWFDLCKEGILRDNEVEVEETFAARISDRTYEPFMPYIISALIYLVIVIGLTYLLKLLERRLAKSDRKQ